METDGKGPDQRHAAREDVTLFVEYDGAEDLLGDYTENLSLGGTFVATHRDFALGTEIKLILQFPGLMEPVSLTGIVRWKREDQPGCGVEFVDANEREVLAMVMDRIRIRDPKVVRQPYRILVVEDNAHIATLIEEGLRNSSRSFGDKLLFFFDRAADGKHACRLLQSNTFDAMIIDVYLPMLDGSDVIRHARRELGLTIPIIAVSGGGSAARQAAITAGADLFLDKPMRLRQVVETIQRLMLNGNGAKPLA